MKQKFILLSALAGLTFSAARAQVGIGTPTPNSTAALDIQSTTRGMLIPRMTATQRTGITTPAQGLMVYQTDAPIGLWMYVNSQWLRMTTTADAGSSSLAKASAANTSSSVIAVILGGTNVPLPDAQYLSGITVNGGNTSFTVPAAGAYRISYNVSTTASLLLSTRVTVNGSGIAALTISPTISLNNFRSEAIVTLAAGDVLQLQMFGLLGAATLSGGASNYMTIQQL
ncbi:BclA C-terminal domain-containing protein [Edaphocola aurantiacus]|uniref:BclA C-terminal domain-containing protein n=1 Tax=Edaphocola aurantiacus TaxID=2601682 RepID=UPI001C97E0D1|nr:hypothetical protein [Edaphocola aurantiacus]